ncbi:MAG TPA: CPBP family intramembrane metalloprotease [Marmoricola sp.]|nr:CPBP family intramembrane metalloprotease [Marmoricola sp.]HNJ78578.1 CPBP family intramembrane metalloprotease [Marmoricola sp.]HNN48910.1 CPBP family intramembrane metalloprotease [Marmoricola sp.]
MSNWTPSGEMVDPRALSHPHPEARNYALILRNWTYSAWKPLVGIMLAGILMLIVLPMALLPVLIIGLVIEKGTSGDFLATINDAVTMKTVTVSGMLYLNLTLASLIPAMWLLVRVLHSMRPRWLASVGPGIRWGFLGACFAATIPALGAMMLVGMLVPGDPNGVEGDPNKLTGQLVAIGIVVLLTTPFQAIGEEYLFRGYLGQAFGALSKSRIVAVLVPSLLFGLAHGLQNFPLFFDRFAFGLAAGLLTVLVGGLEAGIAMHVMNNLLAFGVTLAFGDLSQTLTVTEAPWSQLILTGTQDVVFVVLVLIIARVMKVQTVSAPPRLDQPALVV